MELLEQLDIIAREAKLDGNRAHHHIINKAILEIKRLQLLLNK